MYNRGKELLKRIKHVLMKLLWPLQLIRYCLNKKGFKKKCAELDIKYLDDVQVVNKIIEEKKSLSRFGDGEFLWMIGEDFKSYQKGSESLANRLKEVLLSSQSNLIVGIPSVYNENLLMRYNLKSRVHWINFNSRYLNKYKKFLVQEIYADAQISRCYIDYNCKLFTGEKYSNLKRIWEKQHVVIVEGEKSRVGVGNDLLSNATSIKRIICPSFDAFERYDAILNAVKEHCIDKLVILALGPTATVLAYDIACLNENEYKGRYQAIDLGHFDVEYEWYIRGAHKRIPLEGKFVNESLVKEIPSIELDTTIERIYEESIICKIL